MNGWMGSLLEIDLVKREARESPLPPSLLRSFPAGVLQSTFDQFTVGWGQDWS
jgi:aldehyde:ferredoxin oxidoreductase